MGILQEYKFFIIIAIIVLSLLISNFLLGLKTKEFVDFKLKIVSSLSSNLAIARDTKTISDSFTIDGENFIGKNDTSLFGKKLEGKVEDIFIADGYEHGVITDIGGNYFGTSSSPGKFKMMILVNGYDTNSNHLDWNNDGTCGPAGGADPITPNDYSLGSVAGYTPADRTSANLALRNQACEYSAGDLIDIDGNGKVTLKELNLLKDNNALEFKSRGLDLLENGYLAFVFEDNETTIEMKEKYFIEGTIITTYGQKNAIVIKL